MGLNEHRQGGKKMRVRVVYATASRGSKVKVVIPESRGILLNFFLFFIKKKKNLNTKYWTHAISERIYLPKTKSKKGKKQCLKLALRNTK